MNKLKFRVWCHRIKRFTNVPFLNSTGRQLLWLHSGNKIELTNLDDESEYTLQLSSGLFDKNGVEIFEGDYIRYTPVNAEDLKGLVVQVPALSLFGWFCELEFMLTAENKCDIEVVGNIFQNKELEKDKKFLKIPIYNWKDS